MKMQAYSISLILLMIFIIACSSEPRPNSSGRATNSVVPNKDSTNFHIVTPPPGFILRYTDENFAEWVNPNSDSLQNAGEIVLELVALAYNKSEIVRVTNYGKPYFEADPENYHGKPMQLYESLEIRYLLKDKKYEITHEYSVNPSDDKLGARREYYKSIDKADSVLQLWGAKPIGEWTTGSN